MGPYLSQSKQIKMCCLAALPLGLAVIIMKAYWKILVAGWKMMHVGDGERY